MTSLANKVSDGLSDKAFQEITKIAISDAGLSIPMSKKALVQSRVSRRMRALGLNAVDDYLRKINKEGASSERRELISALTTNVSGFFREQHHFDHLVEHLVPTLRRKLEKKGRVRIWSAGCSSGQEPYTIGMELLKALGSGPKTDVLILGTDIDPIILNTAQDGIYRDSDLQAVSPQDRQKFFRPCGEKFQVTDDLRRLIRFKELNIHADWPMKGHFDAIFCRNVLIYFDDAHQRALWPRFRDLLAPDGFLYIGHSERINPLEGSGFTSKGATIYQKTAQDR